MKMLRFFRLLLKLDHLGHKFSLNYKGEETYQTLIGALLTIVSMVLVGILLVLKATEVIDMKDPTVQVYSRSIYKKEVDSLNEINLGEHHFNFGVQFHYSNID